MIEHSIINYKGVEYKSKLEYYFVLYLEELQKEGFIEDFGYERIKFQLCDNIQAPYKKLKKGVISDCSEALIRENSYQPDFDIIWSKKALNTLVLDRYMPILGNISKIPFRLASDDLSVSYIETKPNNESKLSSSIEFPIHQKWIYQKFGFYIQKVKPYILFEETFTPKKVIDSEIYNNNTKFGKKGDSKLKYKPKTLKEWLDAL